MIIPKPITSRSIVIKIKPVAAFLFCNISPVKNESKLTGKNESNAPAAILNFETFALVFLKVILVTLVKHFL